MKRLKQLEEEKGLRVTGSLLIETFVTQSAYKRHLSCTLKVPL